ncbi:MAG: precorrin-3B C(17)-methyltransferase, partial [Candidatus Nitrosotalea sp.]|nr:precorrin-3B C(17)-methyltransferase [Candidatus Nitrosotalea sp.]
MDSVAIVAITKNGIDTAHLLKQHFPTWKIFSPSKLRQDGKDIEWFDESTTLKIKELFENN